MIAVKIKIGENIAQWYIEKKKIVAKNVARKQNKK